MLASELLLIKGINYKNEELVKCAEALACSEHDFETSLVLEIDENNIEFIKEAGILDMVGKGVFAAGKQLMQNNVFKNMAIGSGVGALSGAMNAGKGNRLDGALKGGAIGAAAGGIGTLGKNVFQASKVPGMTISKALTDQKDLLKDALVNAKSAYMSKMPIPPIP